MKLSDTALLLCIGIALLTASWLWFSALEDVSRYEETPNEEFNVTCYKWVNNGTAQVSCPSKVYAPDAVVNISVKNCSEWTPTYSGEFQRDPPCAQSQNTTQKR
jgi:hypothetical protein